MGMLGAMAGAGKGLQDYSTLMNHKADLDWQSKQAEVKYEREKSLEALRMQNQKDIVGLQGEQSRLNIAAQGDQGIRLNDNQAGHRIEEIGASGVESRKGILLSGTLSGENQINAINAQGAQESRHIGERGAVQGSLMEKQSELNMDESEWKARLQNKYAIIQQDNQAANRFKEIGLTVDADIKKFESETKFKIKALKDERMELASSLKVKLSEDGELSPLEDMKVFSIESGIPFKDLFRAETPMSAEELAKINEMLGGDEAYTKGSFATKLKMVQDAHDVLMGGGGKAPKRGTLTSEDEIIKLATDVSKGEKEALKFLSGLDLTTQTAVKIAQKSLKENKGNAEVVRRDVQMIYEPPADGDVTNYGYVGSRVQPGMFKVREFRAPWADAREKQKAYLESLKK